MSLRSYANVESARRCFHSPLLREQVMPKPTDVRPVGAELYFLPIKPENASEVRPGDHHGGDLRAGSRGRG